MVQLSNTSLCFLNIHWQLLDFNFSFVINMQWRPEKTSIRHTGCLHLFKASCSSAVHATFCMTLQSLCKALSPLVSSVVFHSLPATFPCALPRWYLISALHLSSVGIWPPACILWLRAVLCFCQLWHWCTCRALLSHLSLTCPSQQYVLTLIGRKLIA